MPLLVRMAAGGVRGGPAEAGLPEHPRRPEQLLQHAGGPDPGGLGRAAGPVAGAGGAGIHGLRGHRQLRPALLRAGLRPEAAADGDAAAHQALDVWGLVLGLALFVFLLATTKPILGKGYLYPLLPFDRKALGRLLVRRPISKDNS